MRWHDLLDELEQRNAACERFLQHAGTLPAEVNAPQDIGPLPPELESRARDLLAETERLQTAAAASQAATLRLLSRKPGIVQRRDPACYVDTAT
jgi:hypothetical protein